MDENKTFTLDELDDAIKDELEHFIEVGKKNDSSGVKTVMLSLAMTAFASGIRHRLTDPEENETEEVEDKENGVEV